MDTIAYESVNSISKIGTVAFVLMYKFQILM